jgi:hypothetical protein
MNLNHAAGFSGLAGLACRKVGSHLVVSNLDEDGFAHRIPTQLFVGGANLDGNRSFQVNAQRPVMNPFRVAPLG